MEEKILYVLDYYLPHRGGVETVFEQIITRTLQKGKKIIILTSQFDPSLPSYESHHNQEIYRIGSGRLSFLFGSIALGIKILRKHKIAFIHGSTYTGALPAGILGAFFAKKVLITVHEIFGQLRYRYKPWFFAKLHHIFEWLIYQMPISLFHCVSLYTLNALRVNYGIPDKKLKLIYNGVDKCFWDQDLVTNEEKSQISSLFSLEWKRNLLYYGHTGISKGIDYLIEALPVLIGQYPDLQMIFNFIPAKRQDQVIARLNQLIAQLPSEQQSRIKLSFGLEKEQLRALIASVDGVIAPSLSEGFGSVHTETCAMKIPLITTRIASLPEVISGKSIFIDPASTNSLIEGVKKLKKADFTVLGSQDFDWDMQYEELWQVYQSLLSLKK